MNYPRYGYLYVITILCALFDATISHHFVISTIRPEIVFAIPVFWALEARSDEVTFHAWTAGLLKDLFSVTPLGLYGVLFVIFAFLLCKIRVYLYRDSIITLLFVGFLFELAVNSFHGFGLFVTGANFDMQYLLSTSIYTALYSCIFGAFLLKPMIHNEQFFGFYHL